MALLTPQMSTPTGTVLTFAAASAGGDTFTPGSTSILLVRNSDASSKTVTVVTPGTIYGNAIPDIATTVAAGATTAIGPFLSDLVNTATGLIDITYSAVTSVTVAAVRIL